MLNTTPKPENPYDYSTRNGVREISWNYFHGLVKALVVAVAPWRPEIILPVGRGGYYPGSLMAHMLQVEIYPVRLSRRERDVVVRDTPQWLVLPPAAATGHRVLVVDEISSTGKTLTIVRERLMAMGAGDIRSAVLYAHARGAGAPDYIGLITDELVLNPWDREIYHEDAFTFHPEYIEALKDQGIEAGQDLLIPAPLLLAQKSTAA
jgi:hypoxanthine phosphoribosyltransferase